MAIEMVVDFFWPRGLLIWPDMTWWRHPARDFCEPSISLPLGLFRRWFNEFCQWEIHHDRGICCGNMFVFLGGNPKSAKYVCVCVQDCIQATLTLVVIGSGRTENSAVAKKSCTILDGWHLINRLWIVAFTTYQLVQDFATIHSTRYPLVI